MRNRRSLDRVATLKRASIALDGLASTTPCKVRDLSGTGARLAFDPGTRVPDEFKLVLAQDEMSIDCRVAWRSRNEVGVCFVLPNLGDLAGMPA